MLISIDQVESELLHEKGHLYQIMPDRLVSPQNITEHQKGSMNRLVESCADLYKAIDPDPSEKK